jgi:hypothetical protein
MREEYLRIVDAKDEIANIKRTDNGKDKRLFYL